MAHSDEQAAYWYRKAADQGMAAAQCGLGVLYEEGRGVTKSDEKALQWYQEAALQGSSRACCNMGQMLEVGRGVAQNHD